ncbi:VWA domain-containing protein [Marinospirillum insulare]|uniref:VWFA domain-containing protein n=1 Tax=Marinospirillum insulare TaxID=217169 RepID=A0ABQ5ZVL7_9GAMM|nr:VWA domain-containing protein [Marinospirillum insulare]GLR64209.1 hypothetical protein GCM10007878_16470 [Marinospirillum insulare]
MDTPTNLGFAWPWAVVLLALPWLMAGWLKKRSSGFFNQPPVTSKKALKLPNLDLNLNASDNSSNPQSTEKISQASWLTKLSWRSWLWILLVLALMRPEWQQPEIEVTYLSRQLLLVVDISGSMKELMQERTRLDQVKLVVKNFIEKRPKDHIGLVVFGGEAYLYVPRTLDHQLLIQQLQSLQPGMAGSGTAIGDALGVGIQNLRSEEGKPALLLLTDGANNAGQLKPEEALAMAAAAEITTHLILVDLDKEPAFTNSIKQTGGRVFSAYSQEELARIYEQIHQLEAPTQVSYLRPSVSLAFIPLLMALILALSQTQLIQTLWIKVRPTNE